MVGQAEQVVTGDAVVLDVQIAQLPVRALSALIDIAVIFVGYIAGVMLWASTLSQFDPALSGAVLIIFTVLTIVGYPLIFESATRGRTLGKMALGLRVVSDDGSPERFRQAPVPGTGVGDRDLDVLRRTRGDLQPAVVEGQTHRGRVRRHRRGQRARAEASAAPGDAAVAGVVGVVAATVGTGSRAGRAGPPIPLSGTAVGSSDPRADGTSHRR